MSVSETQVDMRQGYCSGGAGILASALAWSVAAGVAVSGSSQNAVWALLIGGMLIHPVAVLICKLLGARECRCHDWRSTRGGLRGHLPRTAPSLGAP